MILKLEKQILSRDWCHSPIPVTKSLSSASRSDPEGVPTTRRNLHALPRGRCYTLLLKSGAGVLWPKVTDVSISHKFIWQTNAKYLKLLSKLFNNRRAQSGFWLYISRFFPQVCAHKTNKTASHWLIFINQQCLKPVKSWKSDIWKSFSVSHVSIKTSNK